jgi:ribosomal 50S subunit-recycling heat shock protein
MIFRSRRVLAKKTVEARKVKKTKNATKAITMMKMPKTLRITKRLL